MPGFNVGRFFDDCNGVGLVGNPNFLGNGTETARRHRFRLSVSPLAGVTDFQLIIPIACEQIDRPTLRIQSETVWNGADFSRVPLRGEYEPITATFYEIIQDSSASVSSTTEDYSLTLEALLQWWTNASFSVQHSRSGFEAARRVDVLIEQLNGTGGTIWAYHLLRCWPHIMNPDSLSYKDSEISKIQVTLNFDKVIELRLP
jgi:hypothetical protein